MREPNSPEKVSLAGSAASNPPATFEIEVDAAKLGLKAKPSFSEMVANTPIKATPGAKGWTLTVPMEKDMTCVIKIKSADIARKGVGLVGSLAPGSWMPRSGSTSSDFGTSPNIIRAVIDTQATTGNKFYRGEISLP